jgi:DNA-binding CsgD family transcriptional regulator
VHELASSGADGFESAVALALRGRGPRHRDHASGWSGLTRAEAEVAELAAAGLNNLQIAERLFMSRATVKRHLSRVFAQLGVSNRTELARVAELERRGPEAAERPDPPGGEVSRNREARLRSAP